MPHRSPSPCAWPGCSETCIERYCPKHKRLTAKQRGKALNQSRPSPADRGYDARWRRIRAEVLATEPLCRVCGQPATEVHHIQPLRLGGSHDGSNLAPLCHSCHMRIEAQHRARG